MEKLKGGIEGKQCEFTKYKNKVRCLFAVQSKNTKYCNFHAYLDSDEFVLCPVDPSHSVKKEKLEKHVKKCNKTKDNAKLEQSEWYKKDINVVNPLFDLKSVEEPKRLKTFSQAELDAWYIRIDEVWQIVKDQIIQMVDSDQTEEEKLAALGVVDIEEIKESKEPKEEEKKQEKLELTKTTKHTLQHNKIVDMMDNYGLLKHRDIKYLEYGAGRGLLSHYLHERLDSKLSEEEKKNHEENNFEFYLIEREKIRYLADRHYKEHNNHKRIRVDISHFDISHIHQEHSLKKSEKEPSKELEASEEIKEPNTEPDDGKLFSKYLVDPNIKIVGIAKHLCGGATDLAIHSLTQSPLTYGVIIATCCHQRCDERTYVNIDYLNELGFKKDYEKSWLFKTTSWAVSGAYRIDKAAEDDSISKNSLRKTVTGYKAKRILELGRAMILKKKCNLKVSLKQYCSKIESPENMLLIGIRE
ncbi:unnamed protein product [Moneuplotes crassus]|uniref:tRNA:m(4)X modification enzyme TRM13 n=1 Tax=Euplotes crassus TaxID=5936 RepID=A0AAD1UD72_EUPCR|nr:unnamed protein product [Moneuplotes crassus]